MFDEKEIPTPEYWISLLFKRLVGRQVLNVFTDGNVEFRIYGHCSFNTPSGLVVYYINLHERDIGWQLARVRGENYELYSLTPGEDGKLSSRSVKLNGQKLRMTGDNLPSLHPVRSRTWPIIVPSLSYGFLVLPNVSVLACQ
ncbi:inactive heparanase-2-like [Liolophura sinensis]|uniref:inactive heparanase-2-like n=1 Tax=Liolophura sinensis TaxID=3198878 RepID=UPI00315827E1